MLTSVCFAQELVVIKDSISYFTSALNPEQIKFSLEDRQFAKTKNRQIDFGITTNEYCFVVLKLQANQSANSYALSIDNTSPDTVLIFRLQPDGAKQLLYEGGSLIKYNTKRHYVWHTIGLAIEQKPTYFLNRKRKNKFKRRIRRVVFYHE